MLSLPSFFLHFGSQQCFLGAAGGEIFFSSGLLGQRHELLGSLEKSEDNSLGGPLFLKIFSHRSLGRKFFFPQDFLTPNF